MDREKLRKIVEGYYAALRDQDLDAWLALFAEDVISHTPVGAPIVEGHNGLRLAFKTFTNTLRVIDIHADSMFFGGNTVAVKWTTNGTGHNDRKVVFEGINIFEINIQGQIWRIHAYWDPESMMRDLNG